MRITIPLIAISLMPAIQARAVIVDGVAITVGNKAITESEIDQRIRLTAFQNGEKADFSLAARRQAASKLIDQKLIEREMDVGRYPRAAPEAGKNLLADYAKTNYKSNPIAMAAALQTYGLTPQDMADELALQSEMLTFLNLRFRPAVQVTDEDVLKYFTDQIQQGSLNEMRAEIEQKLTIERADKELDAWLQDQRKRTKIEYAEKDLEETAK
jgi:parvulin-like peptidyl-prolyl isomerase